MDVGGRGSSGRDPRAVGFGVRPLAGLVAEVRERLAGFDPALTSARDCLDMVDVLTDLEHSTSAALAFAARRVAQTDMWKGRGHSSPAHWLAAKTGMTLPDAVRSLQTAEAAEKAPTTRDALKNGDLSIAQGNATGRAEAADPKAGAALVQQATDSDASVKEIQQESARIVNAASGDTEAERAAKIRMDRSLRIGSDGDGSSWLHVKGPTVDLARLEAQLKPIIDSVFKQARTEGRRESSEAYAYDALFQLLDRADSSGGSGGNSDGRKGRHRTTEVIVRADLRALDRRHVEPGEVCEIAGHGPVAVSEVWDIIDGGAFIAGLLTDGTDIQKVQHLGRRPTALQRTVLAWETAGTCVVEGCTNRSVIEIDHVDDWADTHITQIADLAAPCRRCHAKKTYDGYTLGPRMANGKRKLIPPHRPPGTTGGTPEAPAHDRTTSDSSTEGRPRPGDALGPHDPDQPGLFDTS